MGYRFTLESANTVANLTCGRIQSCFHSMYESRSTYDSFLNFLDNFSENMYSSTKEQDIDTVCQIRSEIHTYGYDFFSSNVLPKEFHPNTHGKIWNLLKSLVAIFDRCETKSLLLPSVVGSNSNAFDDFMTSQDTLSRLLDWHPADSCLILQPQERLNNGKITIFNAFPNFDVALRQMDRWPAVLFWKNADEFAFLPVRHADDLEVLYALIRFEKKPIYELQRLASSKKKATHYFFQLSDLHFGVKNIDMMERRLRSLIKTQLASLDSNDSVYFVITGDAVDSPTNTNCDDFSEFSDFLKAHSGNKPVFVLGNHDVNQHGLALFNNNQEIANLIGLYPKIKIIEEINVIFLLFNSNTNGKWARGEIGIRQMAKMGDLLDGIENIEHYKLVAVLHHHLIPIPEPDIYDKKWYEKIIPHRILENALQLDDADLFFDWLKQRNIKLVLHGHKHIPFTSERNGITIISCGSSTGQIKHVDSRKTYVSYNILKFNPDEVICSQFVEETIGAGVKNIRTITIAY